MHELCAVREPGALKATIAKDYHILRGVEAEIRPEAGLCKREAAVAGAELEHVLAA